MIRKACQWVGGVAFALFAIGLSIDTSPIIPRNAWVYANPKTLTYFAPICVARDAPPMPVLTVQEAYDLKLKPDADCNNSGGFTQDGRTLTGEFFERVGILPPLRKRWNPDGTWNW